MRLRDLLYFVIVLSLAQAAFGQPGPDLTLRRFVEQSYPDKTAGRKFTFSELCPVETDPVAARVFLEYGSIFSADRSVILPGTCVFSSEQEVKRFQTGLKSKTASIGGVEIELQEAAMNALLEAVRQAEAIGLRISPLDGSIAGGRSFADTVRIWNSRFIPALNHWVARARIKKEDADAALKMPVLEQTARVFVWESQSLYFSTGRNRPIMSSVAPPGTSQHLSLLAFDVVQDGNRAVREILNRNGWYQTVVGDSPHFTYLGVPESKLSERGLRMVSSGGHRYWVPRMPPATPESRRPETAN